MPRTSNKPQLSLYTPGSGPLRKSDRGNEDIDSDTSVRSNTKNLAANRMNRLRQDEMSRSVEFEATTTRMGDLNINQNRRNKKPEQPYFVPAPVAKAREKQKIQQNQFEGNQNERNVNGNMNNERQNYNNERQGHNNEHLSHNNDRQNYNNDRHSHNNDRQSHNSDRQNHGHDRHNPQNRSKRYSKGRQNERNEEWRGQSPNRNFRQGSEPRSTNSRNNDGNWNRPRDTRSVEPQSHPCNRNFGNEKSHMKPPSGRRHSTVGVESDKRIKYPTNLAPRLRKKLMEENKLPNFSQTPPVEEPWDGSSIVFQGSGPHGYQHKPTPNQHMTANNMMYSTLPNRGPRGRGRLPPESHNPNVYRSRTPDKAYINSPHNSRPGTPTFKNRASSNDNVNHEGSRSQTPVNMYRNDERNNRYNRNSEDRITNNNDYMRYERNYRENDNKPTMHGFRESLEAQLSPVSPASPEQSIKINIMPINDTLDWGDEVELHDKLEAEILSDALTRSSSLASLMETSTKSLPANTTNIRTKSKKKRNKKRRSGSSQRDRSLDNQSIPEDYSRNHQTQNPRQRQNSHTSVDSNFKVPESRLRRGSRDSCDRFDGRNRSRNASREPSFDRSHRGGPGGGRENWRDEIRGRHTVERDITIKINPNRESSEKEAAEIKKPGLIFLPQTPKDTTKMPVLTIDERPKLPDAQRKSAGQRALYDPNNPNRPIIIDKPDSRVCNSGTSDSAKLQATTTRPAWHNEQSENWRHCHHPQLLHDIQRADNEMQNYTPSYILTYWTHINSYRNFLMESFEFLLSKDLKFSQLENIEQYFWKILYYNIIETMRKAIVNDPSNKEQYKKFLLYLIDEGTKFFERLLETLEKMHDFKITSFIGANSHQTGSGRVSLALISAQKIYLCLGDLLRYKEQVNETSNFGRCRQLYVKAHEINPKNGRPYKQLALLAVQSKKKLDAVYFNMRSLMSSNPDQSARESLLSLFDDNRKKYEHSERKRRDERQERARLHMKEKESENSTTKPGSLRKETWIRPNGGRRVHRTTQEAKTVDSEEEDLVALSSIEVNKRFVTSYLHVHGKLITKIGMETFHETALQMLKEFRALLQHTPVPLPSTRFLQLLALNMFAIESTQLKDPQLHGYRSELQERALVVSLHMFSLILEKCVSLLSDHINSNPENINSIPQDAQELLPSVKVWCDWMLCHNKIWNPPPSTQDFKVGPAGDAWTRLASLTNLLEKLDLSITNQFIPEVEEGYVQVRLPEDNALNGFTPLMFNTQETAFVSKTVDMESAQFALRLNKLLFFGTCYLCGLEQPVLKLEFQNDSREYVSVVCTTASRSSPNTPPEYNENLLLERSSDEDESAEETSKVAENASSEIQELLTRKVELEKRHRDQEQHWQRVQKILQQSVVSVHIEVKPKNLVPDTNCFIDHLPLLKAIASRNVYTLMVPLIVLNELEGLAKGSKSPAASPRSSVDPLHAIKVTESSKFALEFLGNRHPNVKCITTKGTILTSATFTKEDDTLVDPNMTNDDRILATCMTLCKGNVEQVTAGEPRKLYREVVLLTEDRNLRVKALARDVPVREVPSFLQWAGLG